MEECLHAAAGVAVAGLFLFPPAAYHNTGRGIMATTGTGRTQTGQLY